MAVWRFLAFGLLIVPVTGWSKSQPVSYGTQAGIPIHSVKITDDRERTSLILSDFAQRISPEFRVPDDLRDRVAFWFDIYTKYDDKVHVIHHARYPWIIFEVVDNTERIETGKGPLWLRKDRANKYVEARKREIRKVLNDLIRNPHRHKTDLHKEIFDLVDSAPGGTIKSKLRLAAGSVRAQLGQKGFFRSGLEQSTYYLPHMEEEFDSMGLPTELTRMPFVESSFNTKAKSRVGASGIWQIMPRTGKAYMTVSDLVDERNNPIKATKAAGRLLRSYYKALDSWPLTITSYNHGIGNIKKAIRGARSEHLPTIISRYHKGDFKFASSNFFTCFLAALHAEKYSDLIFADVERVPKKNFKIKQLTAAARPKSLMQKYNLTREEFIRFNLDLIHAVERNSLLPRGLKVFLPGDLDKPLASNEMKKVRL